LTAFHVIGVAPPEITVQMFTGEWLPAQFDATKSLPQQDLAILKVNARPAVCVPLGVISSQQVTDKVLSVGYPLGDRADNPHLGFYDGSISRLRDDGKIETDAVRGQGQSGGLLYHHASQRVIGVAVEGYKPERMIAGLAQRLDSLLAQWAELPEITARVAQQWDKQMLEIPAQVMQTRDKPIDWLQYRWWLIGAVAILLVSGLGYISIRNPPVPPDIPSPGNNLVQNSLTLENNVHRPGSDYHSFNMSQDAPELCRTACQMNLRCVAFDYIKPSAVYADSPPTCWLKDKISPSAINSCCISGVKMEQQGQESPELPSLLKAENEDSIGIFSYLFDNTQSTAGACSPIVSGGVTGNVSTECTTVHTSTK